MQSEIVYFCPLD